MKKGIPTSGCFFLNKLDEATNKRRWTSGWRMWVSESFATFSLLNSLYSFPKKIENVKKVQEMVIRNR